MDKFPIHVFPREIQHIISSLERNLGFDECYTCSAVLLACSASIGKTHKIKVKTSWYETVCLFMALIGRPGANKSHVLTWAIKPLMDATEQNFLRSLEEKDKPKAEDMFSTEIPEASPEQYVANNITPEAIIQIMAESSNTRFLIWSDELSGFLRNLNKYNAGSDVEFLLSVFSGQTTLVNRKINKQKMMIKNAFACIAGTTQPEVLKSIFKNAENNGLRDRFLFTMIEDVMKKKMIKEDLNPDIITKYNCIINKLLLLEFDANGEPKILSLTEGAEDSAIQWFNMNAERINDEPNDLLRGILTKLDTYFFRFALLLQIIRWACGEATLDNVDLHSVKAASELVEYFRVMNTRVLHLISDDPIETLTELQRKVYMSLLGKDGEFSTADGIFYASKQGMAERTFKYFLKRKDLFKRIGTGRYKKLF